MLSSTLDAISPTADNDHYVSNVKLRPLFPAPVARDQSPCVSPLLGRPNQSARTVDVGSMRNVDHQNDEPIVKDLVDDPVRAAAGPPQPLKFPLQRFAGPTWIPREITVDELNDCRNDARRHSVQVTARGARKLDAVLLSPSDGTHRFVRRGTPNSARISVSFTVVSASSSSRA